MKVIQSHGMGVESQAILERWVAEPESRPFKDWAELIVVIAQVGEEHKKDTVVLMEQRTLPLLRDLGVRFVEVARRGHLEKDGIVVLQDTRAPAILHPNGVYKLSDDLLAAGVVPQFGGTHRCAIKFKAFVIDTWLAWEFRGETETPVYFQNAGSFARAWNETPSNEVPFEVFGFNVAESSRIEDSRQYDGPTRHGLYPLEEWRWDRKKCLDYIFERTGLIWKKSHCSFCPFCNEASKGEASAVERWKLQPEETAHGLVVEYNSLCFNPRGHLYRSRAMIDVIRDHGVTEVLEMFEARLNSMKWAIYKVRRIYTKKGKAIRCVERICDGDRGLVRVLFHFLTNGLLLKKLEVIRGITYVMTHRRAVDQYPAVEGFYVMAPAFMQTKCRGPIPKFNERWEVAVQNNTSASPALIEA